ncbi:MAG TPA: hypothetical protein VF147_13505, partial [Vicinamibacterales bacterium]
TFAYAGPASDQPSEIKSSENGAIDQYVQTPVFDALTRPQLVSTTGAADMTVAQSFDAMGNVTSAKSPSMPGTMEFSHDARGLMTEEKLPAIGGGAQAVTKFDYSGGGVLATYTDPTGEPTHTDLDGLGRPVRRTYADTSYEEIHYKYARVWKVRDRQGRWQEFVYDNAGRLDQVLGDGGVLLDDLDYDNEGRLIAWRTPESRIEFGGYDPENRPTSTKQIRLRPNGTAIDEYSQTHQYDGFGRRTSWSMPGGSAVTAGWTSLVQPQYDAAGNVTRLDRSGPAGAGTLLMAEYRAPGRPKHRTLNPGTPAEIRREYEYEPNAGRLSAFRVFAGSTLMAGSEVSYEGTLLKSARLLGLANGERTTSWEYDERGRLRASAAASTDPNAAATIAPNTILPKLNDADFLEEVAKAGAAAPPKTFGETPEGHKIAHAGDPTHPFEYRKADGTDGGAVRTGDAHFLYDFDAKQRLQRVTQRPTGGQGTLLRVVYSYSGLGRMIGRRVEIADATGTTVPPDSAFRLATPGELGSHAGLPPEATFVWDPIADRMVAIFDASTGQLLRQFIHGEMGLDDPVEVTVAEAGGPARYYPVYDEAGDGGLQAILSESGRIVSRTIVSDPYGDGEIAMSGAAVERVTMTRTQSDGVNVDVTFTEPIDATTLASGVTLRSLKLAQPPAVAATSTVTPTLTSDGHTVRWSLTSAEWATLTNAPDASALSVTVTDS